jgi:hypothetical protein
MWHQVGRSLSSTQSLSPTWTGQTQANVTVSLYSEDNIGGTATEIVSTVSVPADSSLVVISKDTSIYLEEDKSIGATASAASDLKVVCSYEEIS